MDELISAADANRSFPQLLRGVREEGATYIVTAHGKPEAKIVSHAADDESTPGTARQSPLQRVASQPRLNIERIWSRDDLYERDG